MKLDGGEEAAAAPVRTVVGYALTLKKKKSFLQPCLINLARSKGIQFVSIDSKRPLSEQGPFDIVLHKLVGKEWSQVIEDYQIEHPEAIVLDPPSSIRRVHNRQLMLESVADLKLPDSYGKVCIPKQLVISKDPSSIPDEVTKAGLRLPLGKLNMFLLWNNMLLSLKFIWILELHGDG